MTCRKSSKRQVIKAASYWSGKSSKWQWIVSVYAKWQVIKAASHWSGMSSKRQWVVSIYVGSMTCRKSLEQQVIKVASHHSGKLSKWQWVVSVHVSSMTCHPYMGLMTCHFDDLPFRWLGIPPSSCNKNPSVLGNEDPSLCVFYLWIAKGVIFPTHPRQNNKTAGALSRS